jgi:hypothetical protein
MKGEARVDGSNIKLRQLGPGKEMALLPSPPLRTGLESFPSSGSSHYKASF